MIQGEKRKKWLLPFTSTLEESKISRDRGKHKYLYHTIHARLFITGVGLVEYTFGVGKLDLLVWILYKHLVGKPRSKVRKVGRRG